MFLRRGMIILAGLLMSSCSAGTESACDGDAVTAALAGAIGKKAVGDARQEANAADASAGITTSSLNAIFDDFKVELSDVRTVRDDPESTKLYCAARLAIVVPKEVLDKADSARSMSELDSLKDLANVQDVDLEGTKFRIDAEYSVQPTDDGKKLFAELDGGGQIVAVVKEVVLAAALEQHVRSVRAEADRESAAIAHEERLAEQAQEAANVEAAKANLAEAKATLDLANQRLNAVWASLPKSQRQQLLAVQRAWIARRTAECRANAAGSSEFAEMREANRLTCEARMASDRADRLEAVRPSYDEYEGDADSAASEAEAPAR